MRGWRGNKTTVVEYVYETPARDLDTVGWLHTNELLARFQRAGLRYGHPGSWEIRSDGPMPAPQAFWGAEALRAAGTDAAARRNIEGTAEQVIFAPLGAMMPETVI